MKGKSVISMTGTIYRSLLAFAMIAATAPAWGVWPAGGGGTGDDRARAVVTAPSGNVYVAGAFDGAAVFDTIEVHSRGLSDIFVAKYSQSGALVWVARAGGNSADEALGLTLDSSENIYVTGTFRNEADFGFGVEISVEAAEADRTNVFVAKLNTAGDWQWARAAGGHWDDAVADIAMVPGNPGGSPPTPALAVIGGQYYCRMEFFGSNPTDPEEAIGAGGCAGSEDTNGPYMFVAAVDSDGNWRWVLDNRTTGSSSIGTLDVTADDDIVVSGSYRDGSLNLGGTALPEAETNTDQFALGGEWHLTSSAPGGSGTFFHVPDWWPPGTHDLTLNTSFDLSATTNPRLTFRHYYSFSTHGQCPSAGVLEYTPYSDQPHVWSRVPASAFTSGGYNGQLPNGGPAWCDETSGFQPVEVRLDQLAGDHQAVRFRWRMVRGNNFWWNYFSPGWWLGGITISDDDQTHFAWTDDTPEYIAALEEVRSTSPDWGWAVGVPDALRINQVRAGSEGDLYVAGAAGAATTLPDGSSNIDDAGAFLARMAGENGVWQWGRSFAGGEATDLVVVDENIYFAGHFSDQIELKPAIAAGTLIATGERDLFVAQANASDGSITGQEWITGGDRYYEQDNGVPGRAGGPGDSVMASISTDGANNLYVAGHYHDQITFGQGSTLTAAAGSSAFVTNLSLQFGVWFEVNDDGQWLVGSPIPAPLGAETGDFTLVPDILIDGVPANETLGERLFWSMPPGADEARLYALDVISNLQINWRVEGEPPQSDARIPVLGGTRWPEDACEPSNGDDCYQVHISGAPVEIEPQGGTLKFAQVLTPSAQASNGQADSGVFTASTPGFAVLMYADGPVADPLQYPLELEVVRTLRASESPDFVRGIRWEIGQPIFDEFHNEPGRTGHVVNENALYDGAGPNAAYDRVSRTGHIIPVNRTSPGRPQDGAKELVVAWYRANARGIFWPQRAIEYAPTWPLDPDRIIIASEQGGEVLGQQPLDPAVFPSLHIYQQPDPELPGYNPNDTHALLAPSSTGSGQLAVFALRSDFGSNLAGDFTSASDPYVLIKYWSDADQRWAYRIYHVTATGAGFDDFRYSGIAGTAVIPPYPVSLLPGCAETIAEGQALDDPQPPPPFFQDYKSGMWGKSEGEGAILYWYPLQPTFVYDITNDDVPDVEEGECIPWLARLPADEGGHASPNVPIPVEYSLAWPGDLPSLIPGETLVKQKRGLPNIFDQAAVEVVFDEHREAMIDAGGAGPEDTLVQLIDPLNPRWVRLDAIPEEVATRLDPETGFQIITGNSDGTFRLPVTIRDRLRYDPINKRLNFSGFFDDSEAGDPKLLLNVMSFREVELLKTTDGSAPDAEEDMPVDRGCREPDDECSWAEAVEALFRLTRNPNGIERICTDSVIGPDGNRVCNEERDVARGELLIAFQDPDNSGFIEPFQAVGISPALSAGATRNTGYVTLAFNNDPSLNPLPVSLNIIRVDCLTYPPPPEPTEILSSYQGHIFSIMPDNIFDEQLTLRHSGDFGGNPDALEFDWFFHPDMDGTPPTPLPDPDGGQLNGWQRFPVPDAQGAIEIVIEGANLQTLSDNWFVSRYRGLPVCENQVDWSLWAGQPGGTPLEQRAQLAEGWVKRVLDRLNPFEARVLDFHSSPVDTFSSMLVQLGERYEGDVPLTSDPGVINELGLIEAYTTVMRRALNLSASATPPVDYGPVNNAVLLVATRLLDFYALLGNEAYADAQDPMINILTTGEFASLAPTIFKFQNQLASLLEQELVLLRGRDNSQGPVAANPVYNRLFWNFTGAEGEVAYALGYGITDQNLDGVIDEFDARILFPQGHGDAWGHYLTAIKTHMSLLRHPFFTWVPRPEATLVAGVPIQVDYFDERKFAKVAADKARTGAEIVNLAYRSAYVEDPAGQWQGYKDTDTQRAWGLSEWARRAGQGAYFDWVLANSILPDEPDDPNALGIQQIDRTTVPELTEITSHFDSIQAQLDQADRGLNPLGLARNVVPFDIDPSQVDAGNTHFEQIFQRALSAMHNVIRVWDYANDLNRMLRFNQDSIDDMTDNVIAGERDYSNRLIEIFGYPYADDIGPGGLYPADYNGPDLYHYMYVDVMELAGKNATLLEGFDPFADARIERFTANYEPLEGGVNFFDLEKDGNYTVDDCSTLPHEKGCALGGLPEGEVLEVDYVTYTSPDFGFSFGKPPEWTSRRRATGALQNIIHDIFMARVDLVRTQQEYENLRSDIEDHMATIEATFRIREEQVRIKNNERNVLHGLTISSETLKQTGAAVTAVGEFVTDIMNSTSECIPKSVIVGLAGGGDVLSVARCTTKTTGLTIGNVSKVLGEGLEIAGNTIAAGKEDVSLASAIEADILDQRLELYNLKGEFDQLLRREPLLRVELYTRIEAIEQLMRAYLQKMAEGQRLLAELVQFRKNGAAAVQEHRYRDMAFRVFRNDALQKYRAAFELAARYVYLAAKTYDYETNLLGSDSRAGERFLTDIVRERSIGQILGTAVSPVPVPGSRGLADPMGKMDLNFEVLKGQMGFNNPQIETNRFSLRNEFFRIENTEDGDARWRQVLEDGRVPDLWQVEEFRRYARPFAPESAGPQPGIVLRVPSTVTFGLNYFGWPLGAGDSAYDPTHFATKVRGVGTWFRDYADLPLSNTPRVYLIPAGSDVLRAPSFDDFTTRDWQVVDQVLPVPFPVGAQDLENANWLPLTDTLIGSFNEIRRYASYRAHHFTEPFDDSQIITDSRLIGRSVWNREWVLIIPGGTMLFDPDEALDTFIHGELIPGGDERDGEGVSDIRLFFSTYSYPGN